MWSIGVHSSLQEPCSGATPIHSAFTKYVGDKVMDKKMAAERRVEDKCKMWYSKLLEKCEE